MSSSSPNERLLIHAKDGNLAGVREALSSGATVQSAWDSEGVDPLMRAAWSGSADCVRELIPLSYAWKKDQQGRGALHYAAGSASSECVELLLPICLPYQGAREKLTALMVAKQLGHEPSVQALARVSDPILSLDESPCAAADLEPAHWRVRASEFLSQARARLGCSLAQKRLLDGLPPSRERDQRMLDAGLLLSASVGDLAETRRFLAGGADPKKVNQMERNALMLAARAGSEECVRELLPVSDPLAYDLHGLTAMAHACQRAQPECARLLAPVSEMGFGQDWGASPLMICVTGLGGPRSLECLKEVLAWTDPMKPDSAQRTALMLAGQHGLGDEVATLLPVSDPLATNENNRRASWLAETAGYSEIAQMLEAAEQAAELRKELGKALGPAPSAAPARRPGL